MGKPLVPRIEKVEDETYAVHFVPDECGPYKVNIKYGDQDVDGSPFTLNAHKIGEVRFLIIRTNIKKS